MRLILTRENKNAGDAAGMASNKNNTNDQETREMTMHPEHIKNYLHDLFRVSVIIHTM